MVALILWSSSPTETVETVPLAYVHATREWARYPQLDCPRRAFEGQVVTRRGNTSVCQIPLGNRTPCFTRIHEIGSFQVDPVRFVGRVVLSISSPRNHEERGVSGRKSR